MDIVTPAAASPSPADDLIQHARFLRALARRIAADADGADDLVQETCVRVLQSSARPREQSRVRAFLARVLTNVHLDRLASERARRAREDAHALARVETTHREAAVAAIARVGQALAVLPPIYRDVLYLRYYESLPRSAVATRLGIPQGTVRTRIQRGLALLRQDLEQRARRDSESDSGGGRSVALAPFTLMLRTPDASSPLPSGWLTALSMNKKMFAAIGAFALGTCWFVLPELFRSGRIPADSVAVATTRAAAVPESGTDAGQPPAVTGRLASRREASLAVGATGRRRFAGQVVYEQTGQGVPFYDFQAGQSELRITTDADGWFDVALDEEPPIRCRLPGHVAAGESRLQPLPQRIIAGVPIAASGAAAAEPELTWQEDVIIRSVAGQDVSSGELLDARLKVRAGPTYWLDVEPPTGYGLTDLRVTLVDPESSASVGRCEATPSGDRRPWVRLPGSCYAAGAKLLRVGTADGLWAGVAAVTSTEGVQREPVRIVLESCGVLAGQVLDELGPVAEARIELQAVDGEIVGRTRTGPDGRFRLRFLRPGRQLLRASEAHHLAKDLGVHVVAGRVQERLVLLRSRPRGGRIAGVVTSVSGTFDGRTHLLLNGQDDQDTWRRIDVEWEEQAGRRVGRFEFRDVGHGRYLLTCNTSLATPIERRTRTVVPPSEDVRFVVRDDVPLEPLGLSVFDARSGAAIERYEFFFRPRGADVSSHSVALPTRPLELSIGQGLQFEWWVRAAGYRLASGTEADFAAGARPVARLEPGWSAAMGLLSMPSLRALAGATLYADGVPVGQSDRFGTLFIDLAARPESLSFDPATWSVHSSATYRSAIRADGSYDPAAWLGVYLQRIQ